MMDWKLPVNEMLKDDITKLNYTLIPPGFQGDVRSVRTMQESLSKVIDVLGEQSAAAQGLNKVITTAEKLQNSPTHYLYLLKDASAEGGRGEVIGLLKVGRKHLFLFDEHDKVCEVEPLCVLDFFVLLDRQRHGYGKILFDHMLQDMQCAPQELAIDGPSPKMERFLAKNYGVDLLIRQNNNFAVSPAFFHNIEEVSKSGRSTPAIAAAVGRFAASKPPSTIATVIHGGGSGGGYYHETSNGPSRPTTPASETPGGLSLSAAPEPRRSPVRVPSPLPGRSPLPVSSPLPAPTPERPSSLRVEPVAEYGARVGARSPAGSSLSRRDSQLTDRGFFDVKFYHNKLW